MTYKVIQSFVCKILRTLFVEGSLYFCDDDKRANDLIKKGFLENQQKKVTKKSKKVSDE